MTKGISSPWGPPLRQPEKEKTTETLWEELRDAADKTTPLLHPVEFLGRVYCVLVDIPAPKDDPNTLPKAKVVMGGLISTLFREVPASVKVFEKQSLWRSRPLDMCVPMDFGDHPLYAAASSHDFELALRMAVDRMALAFTECRVNFPDTARLLKQFKVSIARRT